MVCKRIASAVAEHGQGDFNKYIAQLEKLQSLAVAGIASQWFKLLMNIIL